MNSKKTIRDLSQETGLEPAAEEVANMLGLVEYALPDQSRGIYEFLVATELLGQFSRIEKGEPS
jgi:hypothetical protein